MKTTDFWLKLNSYRYKSADGQPESLRIFARRLGVGKTTITKWERGSLPNLTTLLKIFDNLDLSTQQRLELMRVADPTIEQESINISPEPTTTIEYIKIPIFEPSATIEQIQRVLSGSRHRNYLEIPVEWIEKAVNQGSAYGRADDSAYSNAPADAQVHRLRIYALVSSEDYLVVDVDGATDVDAEKKEKSFTIPFGRVIMVIGQKYLKNIGRE